MPTSSDLRLLLRHPVEFVVGETPAESRFVFHTPDGDRTATANEAIGPLSQGIRVMSADKSVRAWATPAILALRIMARGALGAPNPNELSQLQSAGAAIGPNPGAGQAAIMGFLKALEVDAPPAASTPQRQPYVAPQASSQRPRETTFSWSLIVTFLENPAPDQAAVVRLRVHPRASSWGAFDANDLFNGSTHPMAEDAKEPTAAMLRRLEAWWQPAAALRDPHSRGAVTVSPDSLARLGDRSLAPTFMANRIEVRWPPELVRELSTSAIVRRQETPGSDRPSAFTQGQLFTFDWQVALGQDVLSPTELDQLAASQTGLLRLRDRWVFVDKAKLHRVLENRTHHISALEALRAAVTGEMEIDGRKTEVDTVGWLEEVRRKLAVQDRDIAPAIQPSDLDGHLRDYQLQGLRWMTQLVDLGLGGILADDMGLGKTVMLISLHLQRAVDTTAPTLVVCPASVLGNWEREIKRFAPTVPVHRYHGPGRSLQDVKDGFLVTTYATMRADVIELSEHEPGWGLVVADEAQNIKNPHARTAQAIRDIPAVARLALTGTPVENNLSELWAILDWSTPGLLGTYEQFRRTWSRDIEARRDPEKANGLSQLIRPFVLRRRKSDPGIAPELPPKIETDHRVNLTREQVGLYEAVVRSTMAQIQEAQGIQRRGLVVKLLTQLKQICNHPAQFLREPESKLLGRSGKLGVFDELVDEIVAEEGATLVFTQYAQMGRLLTRHLDEKKIANQFLHGGTTVRGREKMVNEFQAGRMPVFVLSLKAAGVGLNLTRADHVIHYDRWWNPAVEDQATDRAHRIGQTKNVQVHRLISEGTIEESIAELIRSKRSLADAVVNGGEGALTELSDAALADLVRLRR
ncbi:DEAD/DEAH box helicase [Aeromicrobium wangtongii]|uniref:DEAD/DEAH box helicase n=1 Tax=Aeromicrobium wangtongii TaxID=2969247 RepID=A0ABY5M395_9ACTN|nr:DEAD/DEAH box helicase [Aeromicrobium wangtongii]MCD9198290.1 DEAD/DEAH box helicase [Aeromicrobium wangtongii]UUP12322.1 DEAD/DEAH box helicase [Aeromicrobium wangtongii]